jgi:hypothetical protein
MTTGRTRFTFAAQVALMLALLPAAAAAQRGKVVVPVDRGQTPASMGVHGFSVVLVVGGMQGSSASDNVPEAARKALADMKDFLPYKRYQLLDAAWILCCGSENNGVSGKVRGPDSRDYLYVLDPGGVTGAKLNLRFTMREAQDVSMPATITSRLSDTARLEHSRQLYEAIKERDEAELAARTTKQKFDVGVMSGPDLEAAQTRLRRAEQRAQELQRLAGGGSARVTAQAGGGGRSGASGRNIMDSSFSIALGETVVIGTSRLNGDQALIAILTAAAKPGAGR